MIKFISYDGKYPCLCIGTLCIEVNGKQYFFEQAMRSGGGIYGGPHTDWDKHLPNEKYSFISKNIQK